MSLLLNQNLISTKDASEISGYNPDYLSRLCRSGKILGSQVGRNWLVDRKSLELFVLEQSKRNIIRADELSRIRGEEYRNSRQPQLAPQTVTTVPVTRVMLSVSSGRPLLLTPAAAFVASVVVMGGIAYAGFSPIYANVIAQTGASILAFASSETVTGPAHFRVTGHTPHDEMIAYIAPAKISFTSLSDGLEVMDARAHLATLPAFTHARDLSVVASQRRTNLLASTQYSFVDDLHFMQPRTFLDAYATALTHVGNGILTMGIVARDVSTEFMTTRPATVLATRILDAYTNALYVWVQRAPVIATRVSEAQLALGTHVLVTGTAITDQLTTSVRYAPSTVTDLASGTVGKVPFQIEPTGALYEDSLPLAALALHAVPWFVPQPVVNFGERLALAVYGSLHRLANTMGNALVMFFGNPQTDTQLTVIPPSTVVPTQSQEKTTPVYVPPTTGSATPVRALQPVTNITNNFYYTGANITREIFDASLDNLAASINSSGGQSAASSLTTGTLSVTGDATVSGAITATGVINGAYFTSASVTATSSLPQLVTNSFALGNDFVNDLTGDGLVVVDGTLKVSTSTFASTFFAKDGNSFGSTAVLGTTDAQALHFVTNGTPRLAISAVGNVGIGSTTPWAQLSVNPNGLAAGVPEFVIGSSTATHFIVDNAGKVGIGSTTPSVTLAVVGDGSITNSLSIGNGTTALNKTANTLTVTAPTTGTANIVLGDDNNGRSTISSNGSLFNLNHSDGSRFLTANRAGSMILNTNTNGTAIGNVGIGTTTPLQDFVVSHPGNAQFALNTSLGASPIINFLTDGAHRGRIYYSSSSNGLVMQMGLTADNSGIMIGPSNNIGIGSSSPNRKLVVQTTGSVAGGGSIITNTSAAANSGGNLFIVGDQSLTNGLSLTSYSPTYTASTMFGITPANYAEVLSTSGMAGLLVGTQGASPLVFGTVAAERARITATGLFGIGSSSPFAKLSIHANNGETNTTLFAIGSSTASATTTHFIVDNVGRVGIGTPSPTSQLTVSKAAALASTFSFSDGTRTLTDGTNGVLSWNAAAHYGSGSYANTGDTEYFGLNDGSNRASFYVRGFGTGNIFRVDNSSAVPQMLVTSAGLVGIGTTSPYAKLSISGGTSGTAIAVDMATGYSGNLLDLKVASTTKMAVDQAGNIAIAAGLAGSYIGVNAFSGFNPFDNGGRAGINAGGSFYLNIDSNNDQTDRIFQIANNSNALSGGTGLFTVQENGTVGIGTSSPSELLNVYKSTSGDTSILIENNSASYSGSIVSKLKTATREWHFGLGGTNNTPLNDKFYIRDNTSATNRLVIDTNGNMGIGTTSPAQLLSVAGNGYFTGNIGIGNTASAARLDILQSADNNGSGIIIRNLANTGAARIWEDVSNQVRVDGNSGATGNIILNGAGTGLIGIGTSTPTAQLSTTGTVRFSNFGAGSLQTDADGNLSVSSDERLKDINGTFTRGLAEIQQLNPILYHWNAKSGLEQNGQYAGFSAQNVQLSIPEAVGQDNRGYLTLQDRPILAAAVNAIKTLAGQTNLLSIATSTLSVRLSDVEQSVAAAQQPSVPQELTATAIQADSLLASGSVQATSMIALGSISAESLLVPAVHTDYQIGSSTIAVTLPSDVLASNGSVDVFKLATYALASNQALTARFDTLAIRLETLEDRLAQLESSSSNSILPETFFATSTTQRLLASVGFLFENGSTAIRELVVGTRERPTGITLYDQATGEPYCISIKNGAQQMAPGICTAVDLKAQQQAAAALAAAQAAVLQPVIPAPVVSSSTPTTESSDTVVPVVTLVGSASMEIAANSLWTDPGATASDDTDGDLSGKVVTEGGVNPAAPGLYTVTYKVVDIAGNMGQTARTVVVKQPEMPPVPDPVVAQSI